MILLEEISAFARAIANGGLASIAFGVFCTYNWYLMIRGWLKLSSHSLSPLIGGVAGMVAVLISGVGEAKHLWWIPFLLDPGSAWMFGEAAFRNLKSRNNKPHCK